MGDAAEDSGPTICVPPPITELPSGKKPAPGNGGFRFEPDQLDAIIQQWQALADDLDSDSDDAGLLTGITPPGKEFASSDFTDLANPSGEAFAEQHRLMRDYVRRYIEVLEDAKRGITGNEDESGAAIAKVTSGES